MPTLCASHHGCYKVLEWLQRRELQAAAAADGPDALFLAYHNREICKVMHDLHSLRIARGWPQYFTSHIEKLLIARGASKALEIRKELHSFSNEFSKVLEGIVPLAPKVAALQVPATNLALTINWQKQVHTLAGCAEVMGDLATWVKQICTDPSVRMFAASDSARGGNDTMVLPKGFSLTTMLANVRAVVNKNQLLMRAAMAGNCTAGEDGIGNAALAENVRSITSSTNNSATAAAAMAAAAADENPLRLRVSGKHPCNTCPNMYSSLWVHRGVCYECERKSREAGKCPFGKRCKPLAFCPHSKRCFVCDAWSCSACRLTRGDGEDVAIMVERIKPHVVFLDFDRTLATTKGGGSPLQGAHTVDVDLAAMIAGHRNVHVVTRNSHKEDIETFLQREGVEVKMVHSVKRTRSNKCDVVCDPALLPAGETALFVDDDIHEHINPTLMAHPTLHRVLFVRGM